MDLSRCAIHTMTTKPWSLAEAASRYAAAGVRGITVWRQHLPAGGPAEARRILDGSGLATVALCRGGFFPAVDAKARQAALDDNRKAIDEAAAIGAPLVVLVCGAVPGMPLIEARRQIADGIAAVLPHARACGVKLSIEPLHPQYAADRSAVNSMAQARAICEQLNRGHTPQACDDAPVGIAVDVYHVWWDDALEAEIGQAGAQGTLHAFHVCDWKAQQADMLNDRGLMGEGCIPIPAIRAWVERAGFRGFNEVEIFSTANWATDQPTWLARIVDAYRRFV
jgi:sugar phosphate isomerase/epimerase